MMFGTVVMKVPQKQYEEVLKEERAACGVHDNAQLDIKSLQIVVHKFKQMAEVCFLPATVWMDNFMMLCLLHP